jgi:hypothetical protein
MAQIIRIPVSEKEKVSSLTMPARENVKTYRLVPSLGTESPLLLEKPLLHLQLETMPI